MCVTPFQVKDKMTNDTIPVPCGKCPTCKKRRVSGWSFRLTQLSKISMSAHFVTLTYDTKHVPITDKGYMNLSKTDVQLFFKRLRKAHGKSWKYPIKYYVAGEYGTQTNRPHYHILLFNANVMLVQKAWGLGQIHYGSVTGASIGYCLKYMMKEARIPMHKNDDRDREFQLCSKGIGANYITDAMKQWHKSDKNERMYVPLQDGKKISMPRYYKDKIYTDDERKQIAFHQKEKFLELQKQREEEGIKEHGVRWEYVKFEKVKQAFKDMFDKAIDKRLKA